MRKGFEILEHTADIRVKAFGKTLEEVFTNAALGMMSFLYGEDFKCKEIEETEKILLRAEDSEALLVDWLSELLYLSNTYYRAYTQFDVQIVDGKTVAAKVGSCKADAEEDVKAVTFHDLEIKRVGTNLEAVVTLDI